MGLVYHYYSCSLHRRSGSSSAHFVPVASGPYTQYWIARLFRGQSKYALMSITYHPRASCRLQAQEFVATDSDFMYYLH